MSIIKISKENKTPKYKQIVTSIEESILNGSLKKDDKLPSVNAVRDAHKLSRDTVLNAFSDLKTRGIIYSVAGKGNYVLSENITQKRKVFLLFDELNSFKEDLYNSFLGKLENTTVDIFFHHFNSGVFKDLIINANGSYSQYVIMPANLKNTHLVIDKLPAENVYILDQMHPELKKYPAVYQNFEKDIFNSLTEGVHLIKKYEKLILLFSEKKQPQGMLSGFEKFSRENSLTSETISSLADKTPKKGEVYIVPDDKNLIKLIKKTSAETLVLGEDLGVISYNETLLKEIVEGGITTISTNFYKMGATLAEMIMTKKSLKIENENRLIIRKSL